MSTFNYKARTISGQMMTGQLDADNERMLISKLSAMGYAVISVEQVKKTQPLKDIFSKFQRIHLKSISIFARQFSTMINAGLSLVKCLDILSQQTEDKKLQEVIKQVKQAVEDGSTLSSAFGQFPAVFPPMFTNLVNAGEIGGVLDDVMARIASFLEKEQMLKGKVKSAMTYPAIVLFVATGIVLFLVTFVLPTFISMFEGMELELPLPTKILLGISNAIRNYWYIWPFVLVGVVIGFLRYISTPTGKRQYDKIILKVPVFGMLNSKVAISRFANTLGMLLSSGVPVMQALEVTANVAGNVVVTEAIMTSRISIREGENIAGPLADSGVFPPMVTQMIAVGEETGNLGGMLQKISDFYDMEVENTLQSLTSLLEPLLMVGMGVVVGFIVISMFLPMFKLIGGIGG